MIINHINPALMSLINKLLVFLFLSFSSSLFAQICSQPNQFSGFSNQTMSIELGEQFLSSLTINTPSAYLVALNPSNLVVGSREVFGLSQTSIVIYGNNSANQFVGAATGDVIKFQLVQNEFVYDILTPSEFVFIKNTNIIINSEVLVHIHCSTTGSANEVYGCTVPFSLNYDELATFNDLSCIPMISGCTDSLYIEYQEGLNTSDPSACQTLITYGCTNPYACNYDELAIIEDNNCEFSGVIFDCDGVCLADYDLDGVCDSEEVYGCDDIAYIEFEIEATENDGTCFTLIIFGCTYPDFYEYNELATNDDSSCTSLIIVGCLDSTYLEFNSNTTIEDANLCLTPIILGCTNSNYIEYNSEANTLDNSCINFIIYGCTDSAYLEYDVNANTDLVETVCINLIIEGCTDVLACNYNSLANIDDETCYNFYVNLTYIEEDTLINVDTDALNPSYSWIYSIQGNSQDLENVSSVYYPQNNGSYIVEVIDDLNCVVTSQVNLFTLHTIAITNESSLNVFPNPVNEVLNIELESVWTEVDVQVINSLGTKLISRTIERNNLGYNFQLDVSVLPKGIYFLKLSNTKRTVSWIKN
jgi:hypothetical protein